MVHTAPGHGFDDYQTGLKHNLSILSPVDSAARYTTEAGPRLHSKSIFTEGTDEVIALLREEGNLVLEEQYTHKYPYDWRTKKPIIVRATKQWFADVGQIQRAALECIEKDIQMIPESGTVFHVLQ
jgi:isoleucyl-tRNA synthetase